MALTAAALILTGCAVDNHNGEGDWGEEPKLVEIHLDDGRSLPCLFVGRGHTRAMSCDWGAAH
ncbi:hypothetical protein SEA_BANTAM_116 [Gordonia phage Bantam]|uniref:Uncharacterized protein n=1 Tax=Gordonia phage Bantam TaxID=1887641 RepID=A0A1B3AYJ3_9CAUD|nr:hypothetical protein BIZ77_gp063 [Gordonia phage Bantam]AOE43805.1 hypothetical protein SEA_BANTAM_116 [Gordonia phage Bantam]